MLERDAPYVQIIEYFRQEIRSGRLQDGDMLPSGREIARQFGVSLATAAKVATGLQSLGLVVPRPGVGTMVTASRPATDRALGGPLRISLTSRGPTQLGDRIRVLEAALVRAPQSIVAELGTEPGTEVIRRRQITVRGEAPAASLTSWFPAALAARVPELLRKARLGERVKGFEPTWGEDWISARPPTSAEAREFGIKRGSPVAIVHSRRFAADDSVIEYAELVARADARILYRYQYLAPDSQ